MKRGRILVAILFLFLAPGIALGAVSFSLEHPNPVTSGTTFDVIIKIIAQAGDPKIIGYDTWLGYDPQFFQLVANTDLEFFGAGGAYGFNDQPIANPPGWREARAGCLDTTWPFVGVTPPVNKAAVKLTFLALKAGQTHFVPGLFQVLDEQGAPHTGAVANQDITTVASVTVPTLSEYGMIGLIVSLSGVGMVCLRSRIRREKRRGSGLNV